MTTGERRTAERIETAVREGAQSLDLGGLGLKAIPLS